MDVSSRKPDDSVRPSLSHSTGFSLIEILITLFIISIGLLSLAAMQIQGLRGTHSAILRTHAVLYATEMVERLHAATTSSADTPLFCNNETCTGSGISNETILEWQTRLLENLPNGGGTVSLDDATVDISIVWDDHDERRQVNVSMAP